MLPVWQLRENWNINIGVHNRKTWLINIHLNSFRSFTSQHVVLWRLCFYTCLSVHRGEYLGRYPPNQVHSPRKHTPPGSTLPQEAHPQEVHPQKHTPREAPPRKHTPQEAHIPPGSTPLGKHTPWEMADTVDGTHPTGMHSCMGFLYNFTVFMGFYRIKKKSGK